MPVLFALAILQFLHLVTIMLIVTVGCGKKENENPLPNNERTLTHFGANSTATSIVELTFTETPMSSQVTRRDIYHDAAQTLAFPASTRCQNHDDVWRILALYLDYIRTVNPVEFVRFKIMDSALAVLHDFNFYIGSYDLPNETIALAVVYFLVDFHKIKVNLGSGETPWYSVLSRSTRLEDLEKMKVVIGHELVGYKSEETVLSVREGGA